jgi:hypothetical protein
LPSSSFEIAYDQLQNSKTYIKWYWKLYRLIVSAGKTILMVVFIMMVGLTFAGIAVSLFNNAYPQTLTLLIAFLVLTAIMNKLVDQYGD